MKPLHTRRTEPQGHTLTLTTHSTS